MRAPDGSDVSFPIRLSIFWTPWGGRGNRLAAGSSLTEYVQDKFGMTTRRRSYYLLSRDETARVLPRSA